MENKVIIKITVIEKPNGEYKVLTSGNKEEVRLSTTKLGNDHIITIRK